MRSTGKNALILGLVLLLGSAFAMGQPAGHAPGRGKTVHKSGKVEAGVEGGCLLVRDARDHKLYNVLFPTGKKPSAGEKISFTGSLSHGVSTCMEGIAVNVTSWKPLTAADPKHK